MVSILTTLLAGGSGPATEAPPQAQKPETKTHQLQIAQIQLPAGSGDCQERGVGEGHRVPNGFAVPAGQYATYAACLGTNHKLILATIGASPTLDLQTWVEDQITMEPADAGPGVWSTATLSGRRAEEETRTVTFNDSGTRRTRYIKLPGTIYLASVFGPDTAEATALLDAVQFDDFAY